MVWGTAERDSKKAGTESSVAVDATEVKGLEL